MSTLTASRGTRFDLAVLAANLLCVPWIGARIGRWDAGAGALLVFAWAALSLGAFLKRVPLQARLARHGEGESTAAGAEANGTPMGYRVVAFVLLVMLWGLGVALLAAGGEALRGGSGAGGNPGALLGALAGWLPAALFTAALVAPAGGRTSPWRARPGAELAADLLLGVGAVIALAWWEAGFAPELAGIAPEIWLLRPLAVLLVTVPFAIFYLAPRLLFLA
ncbi:MAG: hypothetical protein KJ058_06460 [Thermoanaerobaculia bacterium]|nr:hypothetical protein [Thermoanaerobaculia bacterium]